MAKKAKVIGVFNNKGGILKSNLTCNMAAMYALNGHKVLIVDMDSQANSSQIFGLDADVFVPNIYHTLVEGEHPKRAIVNVYDEMRKEFGEAFEIPSVLKSVDMLPSNDDLVSFEFTVLMDEQYKKTYFHMLRTVIQQVDSIYDYILIDSPPNLGVYAGNILTAADSVLIPFHPETLSKRSLEKTLNAVELFRESQNPSLDVMGIVATKVRMNTKQHKKNYKELVEYTKEAGIHMFKNYVPETIKGAESVDEECLPAVLSNIKFNKEMRQLKAAYAGVFQELRSREGVLTNER